MKRKVLALLLCVCMAAGLLPQSALAADNTALGAMFENATYLTFAADAIAAKDGTCTGYAISDTTLTINGSGTYVVTGSCDNGSIVIGKELTDVTLVLDNLTLSASSTAPIVVKKGSTVNIHLLGESSLTDNEDPAEEDTSEDFEGAVIKVKGGSTVTFCGDGNLNIVANAKNGIKGGSTAALIFNQSGTVTVSGSGSYYGGTESGAAVNSGIACDGSIEFNQGRYVLKTAGDAIKSAPDATDEDEGTEIDTDSAGTITIHGGDFDIDCDGDAIQADTALAITGGRFDIQTWQGYGVWNDTLADAHSCKGLKAAGDRAEEAGIEPAITIRGGSFTLNTGDDAVHSDGNVTVTGGVFVIDTGDDGMHADASLVLGTEGSALARDPDVTIRHSYEGLEGGTVILYSGRYYVTATDDGVNAAGGSSSGSEPGFGGNDNFRPGGPGGRSMTPAVSYNAAAQTPVAESPMEAESETETADETPAEDSDETESTTEEEPPIEETPSEEESPIEETAEAEEPVVEAPADEAPADEAPAEEATETETSDEAAIEEEAPTEDTEEDAAASEPVFAAEDSIGQARTAAAETFAAAGGTAVSDYNIYIYGGELYVNCDGDGLDSNGGLYIYGGRQIVFSMAARGDNSPLDADGTVSIDGATILAAGSTGMETAQDSWFANGQGYTDLRQNYSSGTILNTSADGELVFSCALPKNVNYVMASVPGSTPSIATAGSVTACKGSSWSHSWNDGVESGGLVTYACTACGETESRTADAAVSVAECDHSVSAETIADEGYTVTFAGDEGVASITVYTTQDYATGETIASNGTAVSRNSDTGKPDSSGSGQVNFSVVLNSGYTLDSVSATDGAYKNIKTPSDTGKENTYRITKISADLTVTITTAKSEGGETGGETGLKGDIDGDGDVDIIDVLQLLKYVAGILSEIQGEGDLDGQDGVTILDVLKLLKHVAGIEQL